MKKLISIIIVCAMTATLLIGCTGNSGKTPTAVTVWHYYNADIKIKFDALVQQFNETIGKDKGIIVDAYSRGGVNELADAVLAAANKDIGSDKMPDMFAAYSDSAYRLDKLGVVAELDEYFKKDELELYRDEFIQDGRFNQDGKLRIIPVAKSTEMLFINKTAFNEFANSTGVTLDSLATWEGIVSASGKYYEWTNGKAMFGIDSMSNFMIIGAKQLGDDILSISNGNASVDFSKDNARKLWETFFVPYVKDQYAAVGRFRSDDMKSGCLIMFTGSISSASFFPKSIETSKDDSYETSPLVMPFPYFEGKEKIAVHQGAGMVVTKGDTKKEKACVEFLKWFTAPEQNLDFAVSTSYLPVQIEAMSFEATKAALDVTDDEDVRVQTAKAAYEMLDTYKLYASTPFENSFMIRNVLNDSLMNAAKAAAESVESGSTQIEDAISEESFSEWYTSITKEMDALL